MYICARHSHRRETLCSRFGKTSAGIGSSQIFILYPPKLTLRTPSLRNGVNLSHPELYPVFKRIILSMYANCPGHVTAAQIAGEEASATFPSQTYQAAAPRTPLTLPSAPDARASDASLMDKLPVEILTKIIDRKRRRFPRIFSASFPAERPNADKCPITSSHPA